MRRGKLSAAELPITSNGLPKPRRKQRAIALLAVMVGTWWGAVGFLHLIQAETPPGAFDHLEDTPIIHGTADAVITHALEAAGKHQEPPPHRPLHNIHHQYRDHMEDGFLHQTDVGEADDQQNAAGDGDARAHQGDVAVEDSSSLHAQDQVQASTDSSLAVDTQSTPGRKDTEDAAATGTDTALATERDPQQRVLNTNTGSMDRPTPGGIYTLAVREGGGNMVALTKYAGTVSLVVNVASQCGYTDSNYKGLVALHEKYKDRGFQVLAFPCNQFGQQEPGTHEEIVQFASQNYGATFPIMGKVDVNGANAAAVYTMLKKFLVNRDGQAVERYDMTFDGAQLESDIEGLLAR